MISDTDSTQDAVHSEEARMPLWQHLDELRRVLIRSVMVLGAGCCLTYLFSDRIVLFLEKPLLGVLPAGAKHLYFTGIADKFIVYFKISFLSSLLLTGPFLLYQVWIFVSPALYRHEKRFAVPFVTFGFISFVVGLAFTYVVLIPYGYKFLIEFGSSSDIPLITLTSYFDITLKLMVAMGLVFEMPVLLVLLSRMGIVNPAFLSHYRRHAIVAIAVIAAVATPSPDAFTMLLVMIPLWLLYELSVVAVKWTSKA